MEENRHRACARTGAEPHRAQGEPRGPSVRRPCIPRCFPLEFPLVLAHCPSAQEKGFPATFAISARARRFGAPAPPPGSRRASSPAPPPAASPVSLSPEGALEWGRGHTATAARGAPKRLLLRSASREGRATPHPTPEPPRGPPGAAGPPKPMRQCATRVVGASGGGERSKGGVASVPPSRTENGHFPSGSLQGGDRDRGSGERFPRGRQRGIRPPRRAALLAAPGAMPNWGTRCVGRWGTVLTLFFIASRLPHPVQGSCTASGSPLPFKLCSLDGRTLPGRPTVLLDPVLCGRWN